ncbi:MAG: adenosylcobinamide-GDP ribazoletransferase [Proteobacteria bacterium]|nr:adenosylcobinamide-GDP ribazoletransferase [Pseudomonadota bacterium]
MTALRHFFLALQFFTRIPVTGRLAVWVGFSPAMLRASAAYFPAVGAVIGCLVVALTATLMYYLPTAYAPLVAAALGTAWSVWLTGAFHEDGLADVADGLGGSYDRERALIIMKDSRVGAFGTIAVVLALLSKVALTALLGAVGTLWMCFALMAGHVVSRTWPLLIIRWLPHVGDDAGTKSKPLADQISKGSLILALLWCAAALALSSWVAASVLSGIDGQTLTTAQVLPVLKVLACGGLASALMFVYLLRLFARRLQGFTGDCLGTTQQLCEIALYLGFALALGGGF